MKKIVTIGTGILVLCYMIGMFIFQDRFYFRSYINGVSCGGKTVKSVELEMAEKVKQYELTIKGKNGVEDTIESKDIRLFYVSDRTLQKLKDKQPAYNWLFGSLQKDTDSMRINVTFSKEKLNQVVDGLAFFNKNNVIKSKLPQIKYKKGKLEIEKAIYGTEVKKDILKAAIIEAIESGKKELELEQLDCYVKPKYDENSPEFVKAYQTMERYIATNITYDFEDRTETLDGKQIFSWLSIDKNFKVTISEEEQIDFIRELERQYNTLGLSREFTTHDGRTISVPSGNYGYMISRSRELEQMTKDIKEGKTVKREPEYAYRGYIRKKDDIGNTYVEVDLTNQRMYFFVNGSLYVETDVVTGDLARQMGTPDGVYGVTYKERNAILKGPNYRTEVSYWMPFNQSIGIHDAGWRSKFGGEIYKTQGSHGCVNTPPENARKIFEKIEQGMPVIVHY